MSGSTVSIEHNAPQFAAAIREIADRCGSPDAALQIIGETVTASVQRNFELGGRPGWQPLAPATLAKKRGGSILVDKGFAGGLLGSIHWEVADNVIYVGTDKIYAAIHQFGGQAGRNHKVTIPAREFLMIQDEDIDEILELLQEFIFTGSV